MDSGPVPSERPGMTAEFHLHHLRLRNGSNTLPSRATYDELISSTGQINPVASLP